MPLYLLAHVPTLPTYLVPLYLRTYFTYMHNLPAGRAAMMGITGFAVQECVWGTPVVDQTPFFFLPFGGFTG
jgi:hypothetical protein